MDRSDNTPALSIIVPMRNEATELPGLLAALEAVRGDGCDVLFVDGGSTDASVEMATTAGFPVIGAPMGRARQMNAGARIAKGRILLFLHADSRLPVGAAQEVCAALEGETHHWGRFDVRIDSTTLRLSTVSRLMNWRSRLTGIATGDQAMFVRRALFESVGGFPDQALMEDIELSKRLKRQFRPVCLRGPVVTSARRWETHGIWRTIFLMWRLRWAYWRGTPAEVLARAYR